MNSKTVRALSTAAARAVLAATMSGLAMAALPPVPYPPENPPSEAKRLLGKALFWDEQLSTNGTVACGTCHRPAAGGADPRSAVHPGRDPGSIDDVRGSPGIVSLDTRGRPEEHAVFGRGAQVTPRASLSNFGSLWAGSQFWDGRAGDEFRNPLTGEIVIESGGALENQALTALLNPAEMSHRDRSWADVVARVERSTPLALASGLPADLARRLAAEPGYPALFADAFGDAAVTPVRIAFALAAYQRTLVADDTPWDRFQAGDTDALGRAERLGWRAMRDFKCVNCHTPPLFTNNAFANIGLRRVEFDEGRQGVTGKPEHAGDFRVPSLRNAGLRPRFMHTGEFMTLEAAVGFYRTGMPTPERDDIPDAGIYAFNIDSLTQADIVAFLRNGLTDPRVRDERPPFDRPRLRSERRAAGSTAPPARTSH